MPTVMFNLKLIFSEFMYACMPKTITISDDVYEELKRLKGSSSSFSDVIRSLLGRKSNVEILMIAFGTRSDVEADELKKEVEEMGKWMRSLTQA